DPGECNSVERTGIGAGEDPGVGAIGASQGVGRRASLEVLDVGKGAADAGRRARLQVDAHGSRHGAVIEGVAAAATVDVARHATAILEGERVVAGTAGEVGDGVE